MPGKSHGQRSLVGYRPWGRKRIQHNLATKQQQHWICWVRALCAKFKTKGQNKTLGQRGEGQRGEGVNTVWMCDLPVSTPSSRPPPAKLPCAWHRQPSLSVPKTKRAGFGSISEITMLQEWTKSPLCTGQTFLEHHPGLSPSPSKENSDGLYPGEKLQGFILTICQQKLTLQEAPMSPPPCRIESPRRGLTFIPPTHSSPFCAPVTCPWLVFCLLSSDFVVSLNLCFFLWPHYSSYLLLASPAYRKGLISWTTDNQTGLCCDSAFVEWFIWKASKRLAWQACQGAWGLHKLCPIELIGEGQSFPA